MKLYSSTQLPLSIQRLFKPWPRVKLFKEEISSADDFIETSVAIRKLHYLAAKTPEFTSRSKQKWKYKFAIHAMVIIGLLLIGNSLLTALQAFKIFVDGSTPDIALNLIGPALMLLVASTLLSWRNHILKIILDDQNNHINLEVYHWSESGAILERAKPTLYTKTQTDDILRVSPNIIGIPDWHVFVMGNYSERSKLLLDGTIPTGPILIKKKCARNNITSRRKQERLTG